MDETKGEQMSDFRDKGTLVPKFQLGFLMSLDSDIGVGHESIIGKSPTATLLHEMISDDPARIHVGFLHFTVRRDTCFTYWLCDCLNRFEEHLKMDGLCEAL